MLGGPLTGGPISLAMGYVEANKRLVFCSQTEWSTWGSYVAKGEQFTCLVFFLFFFFFLSYNIYIYLLLTVIDHE